MPKNQFELALEEDEKKKKPGKTAETAPAPTGLNQFQLSVKQERQKLPDKVRDVPGVGAVHFPGWMSDDQISQQIRNRARQTGGEFTGTLERDIREIPGSLLQAGMHPIETLKGMGQQQLEQFQKAGTEAQRTAELIRQGHYGQALLEAPSVLGYGVAGAVPILGPAAAQAGEEFREGQYKTGAAHALELLGPDLLRLTPGQVRIPPRARAMPMTVETQRGLGALEKEGVPLTLGQKLQDPYRQKIELGLKDVKGGKQIAVPFFEGQREKMAGTLVRTARQAGPVARSPYRSARAVQQRLENLIDIGKKSADTQYDAIRQEAAQATKTVQTGTREVPGPRPEATLTPAGMPRTEPVMETFETPVHLDPMKADLQSIYDDLTASMPVARRDYSHGYQVIKELVESDRPYMNAMDFDRSLSAVKGFLQDGNSRLLTKSQGAAKRFIKAGETQLDEALRDVSPDLKPKLQKARDTVRNYHDMDELLSSLHTEPGQLYQELVKSGDTRVDLLTRIQKVAPTELRTVGRMFLEGLVKKATQEGSFFGRVEGIYRDWERMGPETKRILFGAQLTNDLTDFLQGAKRIGSAEGSPTAGRMTALRQWLGSGAGGAAAGVLAFLLGGHEPLVAGEIAGATALGIGAAQNVLRYGKANLTARLWMTPGGIRLMTRAFTLPLNSPAFSQTIRALNAQAILAENQDRQDAAPTTAQAAVPPSTARSPFQEAAAEAAAETERKPSPVGARRATLTSEVQNLLAEASRRHGVPLDLLTQVASRESGGLRNPAEAVSPKGAVGVMQLMPGTAADYGLRESELTDPAKNVDAGARYLRDLLKQYGGNRKLALAAYNAGPGAVQKYHGVPPYKETQDYVSGVR